VKDALFLGSLRLLPKNAFSRVVGAAAHAPLPSAVSKTAVKVFAWAYDIDTDEAELALNEYQTVGDFFTRRLKQGARPIDRRPGFAVSPADGHVLNCGRFSEGRLIQAKGREFALADLLRDTADADRYAGGGWVTVYLSPRDYHRVHHPVEGTITGSRYIPGHLWPVNRAAVENIEDLFCVNERLITFVDGAIGEVATIMVGATSVGHITVSYDTDVETNRDHEAAYRTYDPAISVARGDELGIFHLGSTAIVLFANPKVKIEALTAGQPIRLGEPIARVPTRRRK